MWEDDMETLQKQLMAKEDRDEPEFVVVKRIDGGTITVDLSEIFSITSSPLGDYDEYTIEIELPFDEM